MRFGHSRRQNACLLDETNSVDDIKLDGAIAHAESYDTQSAWGLDSEQQAMDEETGKFFQFISLRSYIPLKIFRSNGHSEVQIVGDNVSTIAAQTEDQEMFSVDEKKEKDSRLLWVGICLAMLTLTVCVLALVSMKGC